MLNINLERKNASISDSEKNKLNKSGTTNLAFLRAKLSQLIEFHK